jgi:hypothetical protein
MLIIFVLAFFAADSAQSSKLECIGPNGIQARGTPILMTCRTRLNEHGPISLEFNVPANLKNHTFIWPMQNTSRVIRLILPLSLDYQRKISCRMNNLRSEICFFAVDFEQSHQEQNIRRSDFTKTKKEDTDYGLLVFFSIFMLFLIFWLFYCLISIK